MSEGDLDEPPSVGGREALSEELRRLQRDFDEAFAEPPPAIEESYVEVLSVRCGGAAYALPLDSLSSFVPMPPSTAAPSRAASFLGLVVQRGAIVPVHDLASLLGADKQPFPRWLAVVRAEVSLGLAVDQLEGHVRIAQSQLRAVGGRRSEGASPEVREIFVDAAGPRQVVDVEGVVERLMTQSRGES